MSSLHRATNEPRVQSQMFSSNMCIKMNTWHRNPFFSWLNDKLFNFAKTRRQGPSSRFNRTPKGGEMRFNFVTRIFLFRLLRPIYNYVHLSKAMGYPNVLLIRIGTSTFACSLDLNLKFILDSLRG